MIRLTLLVMILASVPALDAEDGLRVSLRAQVDVAATIATLADVAELAGDPGLVAIARTAPIAELPSLGGREIDAVAVRGAVGHLLPANLLTITGTCRLSRRARAVAAEDLAAAAADAARAEPGDCEVATVRTSGAVIVPDDGAAPRIVAEALDHASSGEIPYRVRVMRGESELARGLVVLKVERFQRAPVAARAVRRGETLGAGDIRIERVALGRTPLAAPAATAELVGQLARNDIAAGTPLSLMLLQPRNDVHAGQAMVLVFGRDGFEVSTAGEALADGRIGEIIPVRRGSDGQTVKAQVSAVGEARVNY